MTHWELQAVLQRIDATVGASEAHGWLCGALCVRDAYGVAEWLAGIAVDATGTGAMGELAALRDFHLETLATLRSDGFVFQPLLPADDASLGERVAALAQWCGGFLYGIGAGGANEAAARTGDVAEILHDLSEISRAELEPGRGEDSAEADFAELQEFVRAGAQLAWDELAPVRARPVRNEAVH